MAEERELRPGHLRVEERVGGTHRPHPRQEGVQRRLGPALAAPALRGGQSSGAPFPADVPLAPHHPGCQIKRARESRLFFGHLAFRAKDPHDLPSRFHYPGNIATATDRLPKVGQRTDYPFPKESEEWKRRPSDGRPQPSSKP